MKNWHFFQLICMSALLIFGVVSFATRPSTAITSDALVHAIANTYFRVGQDAMLTALSIQERKERAVRKRYGFTSASNGYYTNREDFDIVSNPIVIIDDPRVFDALRLMNNGTVLGLDTNSWAGFDDGKTHRPVHIWTVLKE